MSKRFTDTGKWDKAWFRKLKPKLKVAWFYLCDKCDHAGIWEIDEESLSFNIGEKISIDDLTEAFGERVEIRENDKLLIKSFVEFQYGNLNPENRVHKSVLDKLDKLAPYKPLISPLKGAKDKDKDKDKDMDKDKDKEKEEFLNFWNSFEKLPKVLKLSKERNTKLSARLKESSFDYRKAIPMVLESEFLMGSTGWRADFDWFIANETNIIKILEGKYSNIKQKSSNPVDHAKEQMKRLAAYYDNQGGDHEQG